MKFYAVIEITELMAREAYADAWKCLVETMVEDVATEMRQEIEKWGSEVRNAVES